jgi:hypothetical protein
MPIWESAFLPHVKENAESVFFGFTNALFNLFWELLYFSFQVKHEPH